MHSHAAEDLDKFDVHMDQVGPYQVLFYYDQATPVVLMKAMPLLVPLAT